MTIKRLDGFFSLPKYEEHFRCISKRRLFWVEKLWIMRNLYNCLFAFRQERCRQAQRTHTHTHSYLLIWWGKTPNLVYNIRPNGIWHWNKKTRTKLRQNNEKWQTLCSRGTNICCFVLAYFGNISLPWRIPGVGFANDGWSLQPVWIIHWVFSVCDENSCVSVNRDSFWKMPIRRSTTTHNLFSLHIH